MTLLQGNSPVRIAHTNRIDYLGAMLKESADVILSTYDNAAVAKPQPVVADMWEVCDEQYDLLMDLKHSQACHCAECGRRDQLIEILMRPMR